jgi:membrane protein implicated in regulation of membrane protease activity
VQTKKRSLLEVCCNVGTGILTAYLAWQYIVIPWAKICRLDLNCLIGFHVVLINLVFTVVSVVRGYLWRRIFNRLDK